MTWFRGGKSREIPPVWWAKSRVYAEFYGDEVFELEPDGTLLDLSAMGVDIDEEALKRGALETPYTTSGEMYEWAEKSWKTLREAGYSGVIVKQWHANFGDTAYTSLLYWGP